MSVSEMLDELKAERARIDNAINILENGVSHKARKRGGKRVMSDEARNRISRALRASWKKRKAGEK